MNKTSKKPNAKLKPTHPSPSYGRQLLYSSFFSIASISNLAAGPAVVPAAPTFNQLPTGPRSAAGSVNFTQNQSAIGATMLVNQSTDKAIINWSSFNLGSKAAINFIQPSTSSVTLNRILDSNPSQIQGQISANGQLFFTNPNGIYFGPTSSVSVGSVVATTNSLSDADFLSSKYAFSRNGAAGHIVNEGKISVESAGGFAALLGTSVSNKGLITAQITGTVVLASGESYQLQFDSGNGLLRNILVSPSTLSALVENSELIKAPGGSVVMTAQAASTLLAGVVKNTGSVDASGISDKGGVIRLTASDTIIQSGQLLADAAQHSAADGGQITVISALQNPKSLAQISGVLSAKSGSRGGLGGFIETSASQLVLQPNLQVSTSGSAGSPGTWLLDPTDVTIDSATAGNIATALNANTNVSIVTSAGTPDYSCSITCVSTTAGSGNITVSAPITATGSGSFTLRSSGTIYIDANVSTGGAQNYFGPVVLSNHPVLSTSNAMVYFGSTVDAATSGGSNLTLQQGTGNVMFSGHVGGTNPLSALTTGAGPVSLTGNITSSGAQSFGGDLVLGASSVNLVSSTGGIQVLGSILTQPIYRFFSGGSYSLNGGALINATSQADALGVSYSAGMYSWTPDFSQNNVNVLLVGGGGGGGGGSGGGGGAGGLISTTANFLSTGLYTLQVGVGGFGGTAGNSGNSGSATSGLGLQALGGGGGGKTATPGLTGGSSGASGSGSGNNFGGLTSSSADITQGVQGTDGGLGYPSGGGGGGGSGTGGGSASSTGVGFAGGGGSGRNWSPTGAAVFYAAGGGGGANGAATGALGGSFIGGQGGSASVAATSAGGYGSGGGGGSSGIGSAAASGGDGSAGLIAVAPQYSSSLLINSGAGPFSSGAISSPSSLTILTNSTSASTVTGVMAGTMALIKQGTGSLQLSAANTYTGGTTVADGTLVLSGAGTLGSASGALTLSGTAVLDLQTALTAGSLAMVSGSSITNSAGVSSLTVTGMSSLAGTVTTSGAQTYTGPVTLMANTTLTTANNDVSFGNTVDSQAASNFSLNVNTGSGKSIFTADVGVTQPLSQITTVGNVSIGGNVVTTGDQSYGGNVVLTSESTTFTSATGNITVTGDVSSTFTAPANFDDVYQFLGNGYYSLNSPTNAARVLATNTLDANGISWNGASYTFCKPTGVGSGSILVVGGGGSGGSAYAAGGGGAGGVLYQGNFALTNASYTITVGAGGARTSSTVGQTGSNGSSSTFGNLIAYGGGGGGTCFPSSNGRDGASGGGSGWGSPALPGSAIYSASGNQGSNGLAYSATIGGGVTGLYNHGGGGGGALASSNGNTATTYDMSVNRPTRTFGYTLDGGDGVAYAISGVKTFYGGGGGAGSDGYAGLGGLGGGGSGGHGTTGVIWETNGKQYNGIDALANTGGGGGGGGGNASRYGGAGGSGVVIASVAATKYGELTVNANSGKLLIQGNVSQLSGLNVNVNSATSSQIAGVVSGNLALTKSGTGTLQMFGTNTYSRGSTVTDGVLQASVNSSGYSFTKSISLTSGDTTAVFNSANSAIVAGQAVSGPGIPSGTTVVSVSDFNFVLSAAPTASSSSTLTFTTPNFMMNSPFGVRPVTVTGGQVDLNGKTVGNDFFIGSQNAQGALTNALGNSTAIAAGRIDLTANSTVGGSGHLILSNGFNANDNGTVFVGTGNITATNSQNAFATIASAPGIGDLTLFNGGALKIGAVNLNGGVASGLSSTGLLRIYTYDGDIEVSENIVTTSAANTSSNPALILSAGTLYPANWNYGGQVTVNGSPTISVGSGGIADIYSGNPNLSTGLNALVNSAGTHATSYPYNTQYSINYSRTPALYLAPTSAGYNLIYRSNASITPLYAYLYPNQSLTYGTTPTLTFATSAGSTFGVLYYGLFTQSTGGTTGSNLGNPSVGSISFRNLVTATSGAGTYQLTYNGGLTIANTSYVLSSSNPAVTVTVNKAPLGIAVTGNYSNSTTINGASVTAYGLKNGETLTGFNSILANSSDVADNSTNFVVSATGAIGTASLSNYSITFGARTGGTINTTNTLNLTPVSILATLSNTPLVTTYDGTSTYASLASATLFSVSGLLGGDSISSVTQTVTGVTPAAVAQAGTYTVVPSAAVFGAGTASNYSITYVGSTNTVNRANLSVTATTPSSSVYSGSAITGSYTSTALGGDTFTVTGLASGTNAGSYNSSLAVSGAALANYNTPSITNAALVISPKAVTVTDTARTSTYDGASTYASLANATLFTTSALVGSDSISSVTQTATGVTPTAVAQAGTYAVVPSAAVFGTGTASNYSITYVGSTNTVNRASLNVTGTSRTSTYDGTSTYASLTGSASFTASALLGGDSISSVTQIATGVSPSAVAQAGTYTVVPSAAVFGAGTASNYSITYVGSTNTVNRANLSVTATAPSSAVYNGSAITGSYMSTALGSDTFTVTGLASGTNAGSYNSSLAVSGAALANYNTPSITNTALVISPKAVTVTDTARTSTYDGASTYASLANATVFTTSTLVGGDSISSVTQTATGVSPSAVAQAGTFSVMPSAAVFGPGTASNYTITYVGSANTVNKAPLSITAQPNTKLFDGSVSSLALPVATGLLGTDTVSGLTQTYENTAVGNNKTINVSTYTIADQNAGANYQVNLVKSDAGVINAVPVAVTAPAVTLPASASVVPPIGTAALVVPTALTPVTAVPVASVSVAPAATTGNSGITITTVNTPGQSTTGLITVTVPQSTAVSGTGLTIPLPESVTGTAGAQNTSSLVVTLSNNEPLPSWISFDPATKSLVTSAVPSGALPLSVAVTVGGVRTVIEISESQNK